MEKEFHQNFITLFGDKHTIIDDNEGMFIDDDFIDTPTIKRFMDSYVHREPTNIVFSENMIESNYEINGWVLSVQFRNHMTVMFVDGHEKHDDIFLYGSARESFTNNYVDLFITNQDNFYETIKGVDRIYA